MARPAAQGVTRRSARQSFREEFRRYLRRQFPGWRIGEVTTEADLEHSLSPAYSRAFLKRGGVGWAAIGAPPDGAPPNGAMSFGLIWADYLRRRERRVTVEGLALFLPAGRHRTAALRLPWLNPRALKTALFLYSADAQEALLDPSDYGNLETRLDAPRAHTAAAADKPEQILEARVRAELESIHATLLPGPVYGQAPTFAAGERDVIDLLAADRYGRLAVVELKASAGPAPAASGAGLLDARALARRARRVHRARLFPRRPADPGAAAPAAGGAGLRVPSDHRDDSALPFARRSKSSASDWQ